MNYIRSVDVADRIARVLPMVSDRLQRLTDGLCDTTGLSSVQWQLIDYVHRNGESTIGTLCRALRRAQSSVSELTDRLEEKGLVCRGTGTDRRKSMVALTSEGRRAARDRDQGRSSAVESALTILSHDAQETLLLHLMEILSTTDRIGSVKAGEATVFPESVVQRPDMSSPAWII
ncbi:MAG: winged helix-turn-helix transcriptional regulator [Deltaproteobacteria bacterium]|nr:winged helix-turn-helix transcriptional regulator [Deltaproteobacteria bacterium]